MLFQKCGLLSNQEGGQRGPKTKPFQKPLRIMFNTSQWASAAIKTALKEVNIEQKKKDRPGDDGRDAPKCVTPGVSQTCVACVDTVTVLNFEKMQ